MRRRVNVEVDVIDGAWYVSHFRTVLLPPVLVFVFDSGSGIIHQLYTQSNCKRIPFGILD